jgi:hypothetical protein
VLAAILLFMRSVKEHFDKQTAPKKLTSALWEPIADVLGFWLPTAFAVGAAVVAMLQIYDSNVAWGADPSASLLALAGTAISAAGIGTFLSSLKS